MSEPAQLTQAELDACDISPHVTHGMTYQRSNRYMSLKNLKAKFPSAPESIWVKLENDQLEDYTMNRVFARLLKMDAQFTLHPTDDLELLETCIKEALPIKQWVENLDDDAPRPDFMAWKDGMPSYSMIPTTQLEDVRVVLPIKQPVVVTRRAESPRKRAMMIYADHIARGIPKAETIKAFIEVLNLQPATAQVYYSNAKTAAARG
jgi:hypothetical protein